MGNMLSWIFMTLFEVPPRVFQILDKHTHSLHSQGNARSSSARIETYTGYDGRRKTSGPSLLVPISLQQTVTQLCVTKLKMQNVAMLLKSTVTSQCEKKLWEVCGNYIRFIPSQAPCLKNYFIPTSVVINTFLSERLFVFPLTVRNTIHIYIDVQTDNSGPSDVEYIDGPYGNAP